MRSSLGLILFSTTLALTIEPPCLGADDGPGTYPAELAPGDHLTIKVRVGFDGRYKVGYWTPVEVTLRGGNRPRSGHVELVVPDSDGVRTRVVSDGKIKVEPHDQTVVWVYARFGRDDGRLTVRFVDGEMVHAEQSWDAGSQPDHRHIRRALAVADELVLNIGPSIGVPDTSRAALPGADSRVHVVDIEDGADLPTQWYGYEGVDRVVLATSHAETMRALARPDRMAALAQWVRLGGHLVLCVGRQAAEALASGSPLAELAPAKFAEMVPLRRTTALEAYCDEAARLDISGGDFRLDVPRLVDVEGNIELYEGSRPQDLPLVVRAPRGFGEVVLAAFDLDQPPLASWEGRSRMIGRLFDRPNQLSTDKEEESPRAVATLGYDDLAGQLRSALDRFPGVDAVPFWMVAALVVGYLILIGPLDYWLVKRRLKRMEATWITFPCWVALFCALAYWATYALKGREARVNQVELVDVDLASGLVRGATWMNFFSPHADAYDLSLRLKLPGESVPRYEPRILMAWLGLPGSGMGGMSARSANASPFDRPYDFTPSLDALRGVPVQAWSTKSITARWHCHATLPIEARLRQADDETLSGTITQHLGIDALDARLFYDRWAYPIPLLRDGQELVIGEDLQPLMSKTQFTQQRIIGEKDVSTVYEAASVDVPRILEMMMFHEAAGGSRYTEGLTNRYQGFCDLSRHLRMGRAVLLLRAAAPCGQIVLSGEPTAGTNEERWVYYRFVLPVERGAEKVADDTREATTEN